MSTENLNNKAQSNQEISLSPENIQEVLNVPSASRQSVWCLEAFVPSKNSLLSKFTKKTTITPELLAQLRMEVSLAPGIAQNKIQTLSNQHPSNTNLYMLLAICNYKRFGKTVEKLEDYLSIRSMTKNMGSILSTGNLTIFYLEQFLTIYYFAVTTLLRLQQKVNDELKMQTGVNENSNKVSSAMIVTKYLLSSKKSSLDMLKKIKTSLEKSKLYIPITNETIEEACRAIEQGRMHHRIGISDATRVISYNYTIMSMLIQIPFMAPFVEKSIRMMLSSANTELLQRGYSLQALLMINQIQIQFSIGQMDVVVKKSMTALTTFQSILKKLGRNEIIHSYECDVHFSVAILVELIYPVSSHELRAQMMLLANRALQTILKTDFSPSRGFSQKANNMLHKLMALVDAYS